MNEDEGRKETTTGELDCLFYSSPPPPPSAPPAAASPPAAPAPATAAAAPPFFLLFLFFLSPSPPPSPPPPAPGVGLVAKLTTLLSSSLFLFPSLSSLASLPSPTLSPSLARFDGRPVGPVASLFFFLTLSGLGPLGPRWRFFFGGSRGAPGVVEVGSGEGVGREKGRGLPVIWASSSAETWSLAFSICETGTVSVELLPKSESAPSVPEKGA